MKKTLLPILTIAGVFALVSNVNAASNMGTADIMSKAKIYKQLTAEGTKYLNFGTVTKGVIGGVISVPTSGTATLDSEGDLVFMGGSYPQAAAGEIKITGMPNSSVAITIPTSSTVTDNNTTLAVSEQVLGGIGSDETLALINLGTTGERLMPVGGKLTVTPAATGGDYTGTFTINVTYN